jgi:NAD-dependent deacetylase
VRRAAFQLFRGGVGLWRNYRIEEVASPEAWHRDPRLVWEFYSMRRRVASATKPSPAHFALAQLEDALQDRLFVCTQNVDNPRAGGVEERRPHARTAFQEPLRHLQPPSI